MKKLKLVWNSKMILESRIAYYCAPVIVGIKTANTLWISIKDKVRLDEVLTGTAVSYFLLYEKRDSAFYLIYRMEMMKQTLQKNDIKDIMKELGYVFLDPYSCLNRLKTRYQDYMNHKNSFPHEIGLLLDYPVDDVIEFIKNKGKECSVCGYWKVYCNIEVAICTFATYDQAREIVTNRVLMGEELSKIAKELKFVR